MGKGWSQNPSAFHNCSWCHMTLQSDFFSKSESTLQRVNALNWIKSCLVKRKWFVLEKSGQFRRTNAVTGLPQQSSVLITLMMHINNNTLHFYSTMFFQSTLQTSN